MKTNNHYVFGSLTRISNLESEPFEVHPIERCSWATGDYVVGQYLGANEQLLENHVVELTTGRRRSLVDGDLVVGAFGVRKATQEVVGDWRLIGANHIMFDICGSALFGMETSRSFRRPPAPAFQYRGHVVRDGHKVCMNDFVPNVSATRPPNCPSVLIVGTSTSCGKTVTAQVVIRLMKEMGFRRVIGTKLTGAGFMNDTLSMIEGRADAVCDFVDAGLPSTVLPPQEYLQKLQIMFGILTSLDPDCIVAEIGSSPCEPYNGRIVLEELAPHFIVLCASDAYSVSGLQHELAGIEFRPDVVCGIAANTSAGIDLVQQLSGLKALSLTSEESVNELRMMLKKAISDCAGVVDDQAITACTTVEERY